MKREDLNKNLQRIISEAQAQGIPVPENILPEIRVNKRPKKRFGCCRRENGTFTIEISEFILVCKDEAICNVIAHEVLHTCRGCYDHGKLWKEYAARMNHAYGYRIKRTSTFGEMGLPEPGKSSSDIKYIIKCRKCGREYPRRRSTQVIKEIDSYRCSCGGRLYVLKRG